MLNAWNYEVLRKAFSCTSNLATCPGMLDTSTGPGVGAHQPILKLEVVVFLSRKPSQNPP